MTTQEKINFIREKAIESNPSILDLVFGCQVAHEGSVGNPHIWHVGTVLMITPKGSVEIYSGFSQYKEKESLRIIGRPIRLADVLLALFEMPASKLLGIKTIQELYANIGLHWVLTTDDLTKQSEETIIFLFDLLGGNA